MRKYFLTTAAALAIATPAVAADLYGGYAPPSGDPVYRTAPMVQGDIELSLGRTWADDEKGDFDFNVFQGWARANVPVGNSWNLLAEVGGSAAFGGDFPGGYSSSNINVYGHAWAGANGFRYGVFGGVGFDYLTTGTVGVEAEVDVGNATLGAQASYSFASPDCCGDLNAFGLRGWADYYFTPNTKLTGEVSWWNVDDGGSVDIFGARGRFTQRFAGTPFNMFGEASYYTADQYDVDAVSVLAGFTILLDGAGGTQQEYDHQVPFDFRGPGFLGLEGGAMAASDRRLKKDIVKVGMLTDDIPLYRFRYIWGDEVFVGVMAQDLLALRPDAVIMNASGFYSVDYAALGTRMMRWDEWQAIGSAGRHGSPATDMAIAPAG